MATQIQEDRMYPYAKVTQSRPRNYNITNKFTDFYLFIFSESSKSIASNKKKSPKGLPGMYRDKQLHMKIQQILHAKLQSYTT